MFDAHTFLLVIPTDIDACLLGLLLVFLPSATIFNEEFRGKVDGFLQRTGLDKFQEGGGFFERLQEGFNRLQNGNVPESSYIGNRYKEMEIENEITDIYQTPQNVYPAQQISTNLLPDGNLYQHLNIQPQANNHPGVVTTYQEPTPFPNYQGNPNYQEPSHDLFQFQGQYQIPETKQGTINNVQPIASSYGALVNSYQAIGTNYQTPTAVGKYYQPSSSRKARSLNFCVYT